MQKINLLYIITKLELGGAQKQLLTLINHLDKTRYNVFLLTAPQGPLIKDALAIKGLKLASARSLERVINPFKDFLAIIEIRRFIKKNKIDIVHTHSSKAGILGRWAARLAGTKVILHTVHGWPFHDYQLGLSRRFFIGLERFSARFTDKLVVVSEFDREKGLACGIGQPQQYILIRYGINYAEFAQKDRQIRKELAIKADELVVGMISCFKPQKAPQDFIKLASLIGQGLNNIKFILVGDGILRRTLEKLILKQNLRKQFILTGWRRDTCRLLSAMDVFALTSLWEGLPVAALEAMAASVPVVATDTGGIREIVSDSRTGFLAAPRQTEELSERITVLLKDQALRKKIGENARGSLGLDFSTETMAKNNQDLYELLIKGKGAGHVN